jgi:hypothetical protein
MCKPYGAMMVVRKIEHYMRDAESVGECLWHLNFQDLEPLKEKVQLNGSPKG